MRTTFNAMLGIAMALLVAACGDDDPIRAKEPVAAVRLSWTQQGLVTGQTAPLSATPLDRNGATLADRPMSWRSENATVATVSPQGLVTAKAAGTTVEKSHPTWLRR